MKRSMNCILLQTSFNFYFIKEKESSFFKKFQKARSLKSRVACINLEESILAIKMEICMMLITLI